VLCSRTWSLPPASAFSCGFPYLFQNLDPALYKLRADSTPLSSALGFFHSHRPFRRRRAVAPALHFVSVTRRGQFFPSPPGNFHVHLFFFFSGFSVDDVPPRPLRQPRYSFCSSRNPLFFGRSSSLFLFFAFTYVFFPSFGVCIYGAWTLFFFFFLRWSVPAGHLLDWPFCAGRFLFPTTHCPPNAPLFQVQPVEKFCLNFPLPH